MGHFIVLWIYFNAIQVSTKEYSCLPKVGELLYYIYKAMLSTFQKVDSM